MERFSRCLPVRWRHTSHGLSTLRVVAFVPEGYSRSIIQALSADSGWALTISDTPAGIAQARSESAPVILFDRDLWPGTWREAVGLLTRRSPRPYVILLSPNSDGNLWDELQRFGGSDILRTPIDRETTSRAIERAWLLWRNEQHLRLSKVSR